MRKSRSERSRAQRERQLASLRERVEEHYGFPAAQLSTRTVHILLRAIPAFGHPSDPTQIQDLAHVFWLSMPGCGPHTVREIERYFYVGKDETR
jgi:hypothetical protein